MSSNLEHFSGCWINQRAHKTRCGCVVYSHCSGRLDRCFTVILLLDGQVALPPIAVTEVALGGISQYKLYLAKLPQQSKHNAPKVKTCFRCGKEGYVKSDCRVCYDSHGRPLCGHCHANHRTIDCSRHKTGHKFNTLHTPNASRHSGEKQNVESAAISGN